MSGPQFRAAQEGQAEPTPAKAEKSEAIAHAEGKLKEDGKTKIEA
jgi:hypothetical protein